MNATSSNAKIFFFIAEDFREEIGNNVTAVGLYTANTIVVLTEPDDPEPSPSTPIGMRSLSILLCVTELTGDAEVEVQLIDGTEIQSIGKQLITYPGSNRSANIIVRFVPAVINRFGVKSVRAIVDGQPHDFEYKILKGPL